MMHVVKFLVLHDNYKTIIPLVTPETAPIITPGCTTDQDCPDYTACRNRQCMNPCANDVCSPFATCQVINHQAICSCPDGYIGTPETDCRPRKLIRTCGNVFVVHTI